MLLFGILAMIGALGIAVGDAFLLGNPVSGRTFRRQRLDNLLHVSFQRMFIGHTFGILIIPLMGFGIWQIFLGLRPAGLSHALPPTLMMSYSLVVGAAAHGCFAFLGRSMQLQKQHANVSEVDLEGVVTQFRRLLFPLFGAFLLTLIVGSIWFGLVVWSGNTLYPRWMALMNPLALFVVFGLIGNWLPAPVGGFVRPATGNIAMFVFFLVSTVVLM